MLIRNAEVLEVLQKVDTVVVDKTGTLTEGRPRLTECVGRPAVHRERSAATGRRRSSSRANTRWPGPCSRPPGERNLDTPAGRAISVR